jgi:hypothetical protein
MTDFTLSPVIPVTFENLEWDLTPPHGRVVGGGTLAVGALNATAHYPNGYVSSGLIVALATGGAFVNQLVPWVAAGANGTGTAAGVLVHSVPVARAQGGVNRTKLGVAFMQRGVVAFGKLPYTAAGVGANGGALTDIATARTQLPAIIWQV